MPGKESAKPQLSLPKGGGAIRSLGESFQPNKFTGTAGLSIPIPASPCRGFEPGLGVEYSSGSGNGVFGIGFSLPVPNISRKTSTGIPQYLDDGTDVFLLSNAEDLVPIDAGKSDSLPISGDCDVASVLLGAIPCTSLPQPFDHVQDLSSIWLRNLSIRTIYEKPHF